MAVRSENGNQGSTTSRHSRTLGSGPLLVHRGRRTRGVQRDVHVRQWRECGLDPGTDLCPPQATVAATERWNSYRPHLVAAENSNEVNETCIDVLHLRLPAPMALRREIDHKTRSSQLPSLEHEHASCLDLTPLAGPLVGRVVVGESFAELQGNALAHHSDAVDGVDKRLRPV